MFMPRIRYLSRFSLGVDLPFHELYLHTQTLSSETSSGPAQGVRAAEEVRSSRYIDRKER